MAEFNESDFEGMFDFFILSGLSDGPRSISEIQQRVQWAERLLYVAAKRKGMRVLDSLSEALKSLQGNGSIKLESLGEQTGAETIYAITDAGQYWLEQERVRLTSIASQFIEDSELDTSFRKFLDRRNPLWPN
jgi:DNA-binding PadR family transcriptional regulator